MQFPCPWWTPVSSNITCCNKAIQKRSHKEIWSKIVGFRDSPFWKLPKLNNYQWRLANHKHLTIEQFNPLYKDTNKKSFFSLLKYQSYIRAICFCVTISCTPHIFVSHAYELHPSLPLNSSPMRHHSIDYPQSDNKCISYFKTPCNELISV